MVPEFVEADPVHIGRVAAFMRKADRDEVYASSGKGPYAALEYSLGKSTLARTVLFDGRPEIMFGVGPINILNGIGAPWLLGTDAVRREFRWFTRNSAEWRDEMLRHYSTLRNLVDDRNTLSKRWLAWLGFTLSEPFPIGFEKRPFRLFELRSPDV